MSMAKTKIEIKPEAFADVVVIVIGNNHQWGKGPTLDEALRLAGRPQKYVAYIGRQDTAVSELDGSLCWTAGYAPRAIAAKGMKLDPKKLLLCGA